MSDAVIVALIGALGGVMVASVTEVIKAISAAINKKNGKEDDLQIIKKKLDKQERDSCRTQMLLLISDYPDQTEEILRLAHHYFVELHGNWYMTVLFKKWLVDKNIGKPEWFEVV